MSRSYFHSSVIGFSLLVYRQLHRSVIKEKRDEIILPIINIPFYQTEKDKKIILLYDSLTGLYMCLTPIFTIFHLFCATVLLVEEPIYMYST
jgi:hypothetical protein